MQHSKRDTDVLNSLLDSVGEGEGGMIWENVYEMMTGSIKYGISVNGILFTPKKKWSTDTCYNVDEPWKHVVWKKSVTKDYILYYSIYMKLQIGKSIET